MGIKSAFNVMSYVLNSKENNGSIIDMEKSTAMSNQPDNISDEMEQQLYEKLKEQNSTVTDNELHTIINVANFYVNATNEVTDEHSTKDAIQTITKNAYVQNTMTTLSNAAKSAYDNMGLKDKFKLFIDVFRLKTTKEPEKLKERIENIYNSLDSHLSDNTKQELNDELAKMDLSKDDITTFLQMSMTNEKQTSQLFETTINEYEQLSGKHVVTINDLQNKNHKDVMNEIEQRPEFQELLQQSNNKREVPMLVESEPEEYVSDFDTN